MQRPIVIVRWWSIDDSIDKFDDPFWDKNKNQLNSCLRFITLLAKFLRWWEPLLRRFYESRVLINTCEHCVEIKIAFAINLPGITHDAAQIKHFIVVYRLGKNQARATVACVNKLILGIFLLEISNYNLDNLDKPHLHRSSYRHKIYLWTKFFWSSDVRILLCKPGVTNCLKFCGASRLHWL